ncbi:BZLF2 [macacine gammaherpesvirus 10]|uniref:BZLF2 n=1 Tax=macacine gammaherpesvirus 10 TaxID=2560569 RepID=A0A0S0DLC4_9GAMA|nr:BZLF2 [macacine gammaherpesvirus 10]ALF03238.1 BZLF2 [macacine gammaherpesvirus 10]
MVSFKQLRVPLFTALALVIVLLLAYFLPPRVRGGQVAAAAITWVANPKVEVWPAEPPPPVDFNKTAEQEYGKPEIDLPHWKPTLHTFKVPENYTKPNCTFCNTREYTFSYSGRCFYFTKEKHTWDACFKACAELYECTYFYGPTAKILPVVTGNLKASESLWVGVYKVGEGNWTSLDGGNYQVYQIFGSHCTYVSKSSKVPVSHHECSFHKPCLCVSHRKD